MRVWWVWLFPLLGLGLIGGAVWQALVASRFKAAARHAVGEVVSYYEYTSTSSRGGSTQMYDPVVRFSAGNDRVVEKRSGLASNIRPYRVGQRIKVLYAPDNPEDYRIDSPFRIYFVSGVLGFIGIVFLGVGLLAAFSLAGPQPELVGTPPTDAAQQQAP
jgi:hypothetical protein